MISGFINFISMIIALITLIVFFVMAYRIGKILRILEDYQPIASSNPVNVTSHVNVASRIPRVPSDSKHLVCVKCDQEFEFENTPSGNIRCPHCSTWNIIPKA